MGDWQNFRQMGDPQSPQEKNMFITKKKTITKCSSLALVLVSMHKFLFFRTLHLTGGFDMTKFAHTFFAEQHTMPIWNVNGKQCQSETYFRMAHASEWHMLLNGMPHVLAKFRNIPCGFPLEEHAQEHEKGLWLSDPYSKWLGPTQQLNH